MPDPRKTINPETGKPIGEDRLTVWDRRYVPDANQPAPGGVDTVDTSTSEGQSSTARGAFVEVNDDKSVDEIVDEMMELLFP